MPQPHQHRAFTLIELLVVITIIVVLLALLAPALDRAVYQAQLAVCASHLRVIGGAVTTYAAGERRSYPHRAQFSEPGVGWQTALMYNGDDAVNAAVMNEAGAAPTKKFDDREALRPIVAINATLNDPLTKAVDLEDFDANCFGYAPYTRWFGWAYSSGGVKLRGMFKLGDRFNWIDPVKGEMQFDLLAQDHDITNNAGVGQSAHPDREGSTPQLVLQNQTFSVAGYPMKTTASFWRGVRGTNDLNYGYADGSVRRRENVAWRDPHMRFTPYQSNKATVWLETLPPQ